jgi:hypothetical protein
VHNIARRVVISGCHHCDWMSLSPVGETERKHATTNVCTTWPSGLSSHLLPFRSLLQKADWYFSVNGFQELKICIIILCFFTFAKWGRPFRILHRPTLHPSHHVVYSKAWPLFCGGWLEIMYQIVIQHFWNQIWAPKFFLKEKLHAQGEISAF